MDENPGLSDQYRAASPWPLFVALGLPIAEVGVLFGFFPIAVGGLLLFCGSIAGLMTESGYASTPWRALAVLSLVVLGLGAAILFNGSVSLPTRGRAVLAAGGILLAAGLGGELLSIDDPEPTA